MNRAIRDADTRDASGSAPPKQNGNEKEEMTRLLQFVVGEGSGI